MSNREQELLIARYLDGTESPEELARLDELTRTDAGFRRELFRLTAQDATVRVKFIEESSSRTALTSGEFGTVAATRPPLVWRRGWKWLWERHSGTGIAPGGWIAAAAALLIASQIVWPRLLDGNAPNIGVVAETRGEVSGKAGAQSWHRGDRLRPGDLILTGGNGYLRYAYADGTVMELGANAEFILQAGNHPAALAGRLNRGMLTAHVRKQPENRRMLLTTPIARATVKGTVLQFRADPGCTELNVLTGQVELATATCRANVGAGESAAAETNRLSKFLDPQAPDDERRYVEGAILFQDDFSRGFVNWQLYRTLRGTSQMTGTSTNRCPQIALARVVRDSHEKNVASLTGGVPDGGRVGIWMWERCRVYSPQGATMSYDYTYEGRQRRAMEGIEIDRFCPPSAGALGDKITLLARPAGEWNRVHWRFTPGMDADGNRYEDVQLFFNGQRIGRRYEYYLSSEEYDWFGLVLEVRDGHLLFDNVVIRELQKVK